MPEPEQSLPQEIEAKQSLSGLKPETIVETVLPVYLIDGVAYPTDKEPPGFHVTKGVKYANVDEALKHMANVSAPDSLTIPYLQEKIKANEDWLAAALTKIAEIETVTITELSDEVRVLEEAAIEPVKEEIIIKK